MTTAIVYAFAVQQGLAAPSGAAPLTVLGRQLPRLVVQLLNGRGDRGLRFFPFIGRDNGARRFLELEEVLAPDSLLQLHGQKPVPQIVADGRIQESGLRLRILDGESGRARFDQEVPFDPSDPLPSVSRVMFELAGVLGWTGAPPPVTDLQHDALTAYWVARDELLRLEGDLVVHDELGALRASRQAFALAPESREVRDVLLDVSGRLLSRGAAVTEVIAALQAACETVDVPALDAGAKVSFLDGAVAVLASGGQARAAAGVSRRLAQLQPSHPEAAARAAAFAFDEGELSSAKALLDAAIAAGNSSPVVLAQLVLVEEQAGNSERRAELAAQLCERPDLNPPTARVCVAWLLEQRRNAEALEILDDVIARHPNHAGVLFDRGRALLLADRAADAVAALEACLRQAPAVALKREAQRCLALARVPGALGAIRAVDEALAEGQLSLALKRSRQLCRQAPNLAEAWVQLGSVRQELGQPRRAERALRRAIAVAPQNGEAYNRLGILLVGRGCHEEGHELLTQAASLLPQDSSVWIHLAQACHFLGLHDEGRHALTEAQRHGAEAATVEEVRRTFF